MAWPSEGQWIQETAHYEQKVHEESHSADEADEADEDVGEVHANFQREPRSVYIHEIASGASMVSLHSALGDAERRGPPERLRTSLGIPAVVNGTVLWSDVPHFAHSLPVAVAVMEVALALTAGLAHAFLQAA